ncbi:MAG: TonB-dependent receptor [Alphaproteobacteria bacterium]|nr:TonB-dependent receptor [Alphaproteobacteria bacterium]
MAINKSSFLGGLCLLASVPAARAAPAGAPAPVHDQDQVIVTASPLVQDQFDVLQGVSALSGEDLSKAASLSLGDTVARLPGVSQTGYTFGASRPIIRGLGGDRIRVLIDGLGTFDASTASPDHAPSVDMTTARRIEVVRGPATLLYGSSAAGGVVNVIDGRIPTALPKDGLEATASGFYGTNGSERTGSGGVTVQLGSSPLVAHLDGSYRKTGDITVPGFARSDRQRALDPRPVELSGKLPDSDVREASVSGGLSYVGEDGYLGVAVSHFNTNYGIPVNIDQPLELPDTRIAMHQTRVDVSGELRSPFLVFQSASLRFGYGDYEHAEKNGNVTGTRFLNKQWETRLELKQKPWGDLTGAWGVQGSGRDFRVLGDEAFVPPSQTDRIGVFTVQRLDIGAVALEAGMRFENQDLTAPDIGYRSSIGTLSASAGVSYTFADDWLAGVSAYRTERAPSAEEVLADGPHDATFTYEKGDLTLGKETARGVELTLKKSSGPVSGTLNAYYTTYGDFISEQYTGEEKDGLRVVQFTPVSARFYGFEAEVSADLWRSADGVLKADAQADCVHAQDTTNDRPLPRIPPLRVTGGIEYAADAFDARAEVQWARKQDRFGLSELPTDGYTTVNLSLDWHPFADRNLVLMLEARNLNDAEIRYSTSFLKDYLPAAGRNVRIGFRVQL